MYPRRGRRTARGARWRRSRRSAAWEAACAELEADCDAGLILGCDRLCRPDLAFSSTTLSSPPPPPPPLPPRRAAPPWRRHLCAARRAAGRGRRPGARRCGRPCTERRGGYGGLWAAEAHSCDGCAAAGVVQQAGPRWISPGRRCGGAPRGSLAATAHCGAAAATPAGSRSAVSAVGGGGGGARGAGRVGDAASGGDDCPRALHPVNAHASAAPRCSPCRP